MNHHADHIERRLAVDLRDLLELHHVDPVAAERIRQAVIAGLVAMTRPASLSERAIDSEG